jgi:hypothetical protein
MRAPLEVCSAPRPARFFEWLPPTMEPFEGAFPMNLTDVTPNQDPDGYVIFFAQRIS